MKTHSFAKINNKIDFIATYEDNTIWTKLLLVDWLAFTQYEDNLDRFLAYIDAKIIESTQLPPHWDYTFINIKRISAILSYIANAIDIYTEYNVMHLAKEDKDKILSVAKKAQTMFQNLSTNEKIINKFKILKKDNNDKEQVLLLNHWLKNFFDINMKKETKEEYIKLISQLETYSDQFQKNHQEALWLEEYALYIPLNKSNWLAGIHTNILDIGKRNAKHINKEGWVFYIEDTTASLLLGQAQNRLFRKKIYENYQALNSDKRLLMNNDAVLRNILSTKQKVAQLYKKDNYSELVLSSYIINKTEDVYNYLDSLEYELKPLIKNVNRNLATQASEDGIKELKPWDIPYYYTQIKNNNSFTKADIFSQYFSFEDLWPKLLKSLATKLDIQITKQTYALANENNELLFYCLTDKRSNKVGYLMISPYDNEFKVLPCEKDILFSEYLENDNLLPFVQYISLELTKGKNRTPLSLESLSIILHELGHAFHSFFSPTKDALVNTSQIGWDLIELPSQFLEHLVYDKNFLIPLSKHYKTKAKITEDIIHGVIEKAQYFQGYETYKDILKYRANFWLHENFKPYSTKNPHQIVEDKLASEGVIYNIARDERMLCLHHEMDYGTTGYIYLYSAQLAFQLYEYYIDNDGHNQPFILRNIYEDIFNDPKNGKMKDYLEKYVELDKTNMLKFLQKKWDVDLYGINNWKVKQNNLNKVLFRES